MPEYRVYALVRGSKYLGTVEADSKEEAEKVAWNELDHFVGLCHQCSKEIDDPEVDELDILENE